ncbi:MAG TPA: DUF2461 domain-containing protein [Streptosporangiaceae bacterium]|nr:DUF2461 domain-containing protein [Streptosporangiaceae bacterium]
MSFQGWPEEALDFYDGLEADNSKTYWQAHKQVYETCVLAPMRELLEDLGPEHGEGKIFRPYRDVRFSKDKSPYKTTISAVIGDGYIQLSSRGLGVGSGMHEMAPDQLERYREAVAADDSGPALEKLVEGIRQQDIGVHGHEVLKSAPRGYPADHPRIELLRCRGLVAWQEWPVEAWLGTVAAKDKITGFLAVTAPLTDWLARHVGESRIASR